MWFDARFTRFKEKAMSVEKKCLYCGGSGHNCAECGCPIGGNGVVCNCDVTKGYDCEFIEECEECGGDGFRTPLEAGRAEA
jgi:hypothetical protein